MIVYRLEANNNAGPMGISGGRAPFDADIRPHDDPYDQMSLKKVKHFTYDEMDLRICQGHRFAWSSVEKLACFVRFPRNVDNSNFRVVCYEVEDNSLVFPDGQVLFDLDTASAIGGCMYGHISDLLYNDN